ncbi:hypothetical protein U9M48_001619 [Paspalum notatum var. saurae]|uniref:Uncharacterized protein n=1 Tax=Paspalum notatum var. saurae TaxID=547442 RepID=A0AAQ3PIE9_PASNO
MAIAPLERLEDDPTAPRPGPMPLERRSQGRRASATVEVRRGLGTGAVEESAAAFAEAVLVKNAILDGVVELPENGGVEGRDDELHGESRHHTHLLVAGVLPRVLLLVTRTRAACVITAANAEIQAMNVLLKKLGDNSTQVLTGADAMAACRATFGKHLSAGKRDAIRELFPGTVWVEEVPSPCVA